MKIKSEDKRFWAEACAANAPGLGAALLVAALVALFVLLRRRG